MLRVTAQIERKCKPRLPILYFRLTVTPGCAVPQLLQINSDISRPARNDASNGTSNARFEVPEAVLCKGQDYWDALCHWVPLSDVSKYGSA